MIYFIDHKLALTIARIIALIVALAGISSRARVDNRGHRENS